MIYRIFIFISALLIIGLIVLKLIQIQNTKQIETVWKSLYRVKKREVLMLGELLYLI